LGTTILTGILRSKIKRVDTPTGERDSCDSDAHGDKANGKSLVATDVASHNQTNDW